MLKARPDLNKLLPLDPLDQDSLPHQFSDLRSSPLFNHLLQRLQRRYLGLALDRLSDNAEFQAGVIEGAKKMLDEIDLALQAVKRELPSDAEGTE